MQSFIKIAFNGEEVSLSYLDEGSKNLPTLLLVHGNSSSSETFFDLVRSLKNSYRVIAIDLPGHGKSSPLLRNKYSVKNLGQILVSFLKELDLEIIALLGHSLGGHISIQALNQINPLHLITWGTPPMTNPPIIQEMFLPNPVSSFFFKNEVKENEVLELYKETHFTNTSDGFLKYSQSFHSADQRFREELINEIGTLDFKDELMELKRFTGNIIFIHGSKDTFVNKNYIQRHLGEFKYLEVQNASHYIQNDNPTDLSIKLLECLKPVNPKVIELQIEK